MTETRIIDSPQPGFWMVHMGRQKPEAPAAIMRVQTLREPGNEVNRMERSPFLVGYLAGGVVDWFDVWTRRGRPISEDEYEYRLARTDWAKQYAPTLPEANPNKQIDLTSIPLPF